MEKASEYNPADRIDRTRNLFLANLFNRIYDNSRIIQDERYTEQERVSALGNLIEDMLEESDKYKADVSKKIEAVQMDESVIDRERTISMLQSELDTIITFAVKKLGDSMGEMFFEDYIAIRDAILNEVVALSGDLERSLDSTEKIKRKVDGDPEDYDFNLLRGEVLDKDRKAVVQKYQQSLDELTTLRGIIDKSLGVNPWEPSDLANFQVRHLLEDLATQNIAFIPSEFTYKQTLSKNQIIALCGVAFTAAIFLIASLAYDNFDSSENTQQYLLGVQYASILMFVLSFGIANLYGLAYPGIRSQYLHGKYKKIINKGLEDFPDVAMAIGDEVDTPTTLEDLNDEDEDLIDFPTSNKGQGNLEG